MHRSVSTHGPLSIYKFKLRYLTIVDKSRASVRVTLFRGAAEKFEADEEEIIAFKGLEVQDFQGEPAHQSQSSPHISLLPLMILTLMVICIRRRRLSATELFKLDDYPPRSD